MLHWRNIRKEESDVRAKGDFGPPGIQVIVRVSQNDVLLFAESIQGLFAMCPSMFSWHFLTVSVVLSPFAQDDLPNPPRMQEL